MKSVGEAMAIGRNFTEALQKALRSLEDKKAPSSTGTRSGSTSTRPRCSRRSSVPHDGRLKKVMDALRAGATAEEVFEATGDRPLVRRPAAADQRGRRRGDRGRRADPGAAAQGQAARLLRRPDRQDPRHERGRRPRRPARARHPAGLQDRRHLRRRVRRAHAVPLLLLRRGDRGRAAREAGGDHPRLRAEPDRPGHRVRLLLRARAHGARQRGRLRDGDGQLQPRDRLDRLRHLRPALLRAAHARGRARDRARRAAGRPGRGRDLPARRPDPARAGAGPQGRRRPDRRHPPGGDPPRRGARRVRPGARRGRACPRPSTAWRPSFAEARGDRRRDRLPGAGAAVVRPRRARHGDRLRRRRARGLHRPGDRGQPGAPGAGRPVHRRRGRDRRRRAVRRRGALPRRRDGAHRGGRHPLRRLLVRAAADHPRRRRDRPDPRGHRGDRPRRRRARAAQHPVRARLRRALRAGGQPAGQPHGAVRLQGDRHPAGQGRRPGDAGRDDRRAARRGRAARRPGTAARCRPTSRSRSRRR